MDKHIRTSNYKCACTPVYDANLHHHHQQSPSPSLNAFKPPHLHSHNYLMLNSFGAPFAYSVYYMSQQQFTYSIELHLIRNAPKYDLLHE